MGRFGLLIILVAGLGGMGLAQTSANPSETPAPPDATSTSGPENSATMSPASEAASPDAAREREETRDSLLDLPSLAKDKVTLIGGRVVKVDRVLDRMEVQAFGGKRIELNFDVRTQVSRDGVKVAAKEIRPGDRVYMDTVLNDRKPFAKSIRIVTTRGPMNGHGQVLAYDPGSGKLTLRDELFAQPVTLRLTPETVIRKDQGTGSPADLQPGTLVAVSFTPGGEGVTREVSVLAVPGSSFAFSGPVTYLNLASHLLAVANKSDGRTYDIAFAPNTSGISRDLQEGADVTVNAAFDGKHYVAQNITVNTTASKP